MSIMKLEMSFFFFFQSKLTARSPARMILGNALWVLSQRTLSLIPMSSSWKSKMGEREEWIGGHKYTSLPFLWTQKKQRPFWSSIHCSGHMWEDCLEHLILASLTLSLKGWSYPVILRHTSLTNYSNPPSQISPSYGLNCVHLPSTLHSCQIPLLEVLISSPLKCDFIWKWGNCRWN